MVQPLGISEEGLHTALKVREDYRQHRPICIPGKDHPRLLVPEYLLNHSMDLRSFEDPLALAMMATRDPESPMALAAIARLSRLGGRLQLVFGVIRLVGETTRHDLVRKCIELIEESSFNPQAIAMIRHHTSRFIIRTRQQYTTALRHNLEALLEGAVSPRKFVDEFFELTEAGNIRLQIREKMITGLLLSKTIRPSIKFLMLENFHRVPELTRRAIVSQVLSAEPGHHVDVIKEELKWIIGQEKTAKKPAPMVH